MTHSPTKTAAIILNGGQSSRMGHDKSQLLWRGIPLIDHIATTLQHAGLPNLFVSGFSNQYSAIPDLTLDHHGPVMGICSSFRHLQSAYATLLFTPVDLPLLSVSWLIQFLQTFDQQPSTLAQQTAHHPLPCLLRVSELTQRHVAQTLRALQQGASCSMRQFLAPLNPRVIVADAASNLALRNINTPQDWQHLQKENPYEITP